MAPEKKIVDASVFVKWFLNERGAEKARQLREEHIAGRILIVVPELAFLEVLNALRYKGKSEDYLLKVNQLLCDTQLHVEKINTFLLDKAIQVALKYDLSLYDALYVSLANLFGTTLITADKALKGIPNTVLLDD